MFKTARRNARTHNLLVTDRAPKPGSGDRFEPQVQFNWGYHDGAAHADRGNQPVWGFTGQPIDEFLDRHFNPTWAAGFRAGRADFLAGAYTANSSNAWARHNA